MMQNKKLFSDFAPVSKAQWKEKIIVDLKGADFDKKLVWHTDAGFDVQPMYTREDLKDLTRQIPLKNAEDASASNAWRINELFFVRDIEKAHQRVLHVLENGADSLAFVFSTQPDFSQINILLEEVDAEKIELNFRLPDPVDLIRQLNQLADKRGWNKANMKGSVYCDPVSEVKNDFSEVKTLLESVKSFPKFHCLTLDVSGFYNRGGSTVTELGFALAYGAETLQKLGEAGFEPEEIAARLRFNFAVGSQYFFEMAKFRAFRYLWAQVLGAYGVKEASVYIHATNALLNKTLYDPYVNMLRTTTETMSAVLGGVDAFTVMPFDAVFEEPTKRAIRVARNQQNLLKEESFFHKVADPAAGSYYIENLTDQLISESWKLFLEVDEKGGYLVAKEQGIVDERLNKEAQNKIQKVKQRKQSVLGVNIYPNPTEKLELTLPENYFSNLFRASADVEKLRYQTDVYAQTNKRPVVWLFTYGDLTMRRARAQFASGFFGCAGYEIVDHPGFESLEKGIQQAQQEKPDVVVLCGSDEDYKTMALPAFEALKKNTLVVLAGYPADQLEELKAAGMEHFIHVRSNLMEELEKYQQVLGI
ncbi:MAG: methylmalonyl-CoA mutase small subunit [Bacteroidales bacterium]|nr:methylmalonyl-CoA mutase small subunit [Bacteroidales bacterium]